jgi:hypothetical protein
LKYTENHAFKYDLDRGILDTVRIADDVPMDLTSSFTYEHITTGTSETISPVDFIKRRGPASEFVSSATDKCEPYSVGFGKIDVPGTWCNWEQDFLNSGLLPSDCNRVLGLVLEANSLSEDKIKRAREVFVLGQKLASVA